MRQPLPSFGYMACGSAGGVAGRRRSRGCVVGGVAGGVAGDLTAAKGGVAARVAGGVAGDLTAAARDVAETVAGGIAGGVGGDQAGEKPGGDQTSEHSPKSKKCRLEVMAEDVLRRSQESEARMRNVLTELRSIIAAGSSGSQASMAPMQTVIADAAGAVAEAEANMHASIYCYIAIASHMQKVAEAVREMEASMAPVQTVAEAVQHSEASMAFFEL